MWRQGQWLDDVVASEEPLEIRVEGQPLTVTMRSPGHDLELALGLLLAEGVICDADDLSALEVVAENVVDCRLASGTAAQRAAIGRAVRQVITSSACGLCGRQQLDRVKVSATRPAPALALPAARLHALPAALRDAQPGFRDTGGLHGAALVDDRGALAVVREDVGRHNAVDKVLGWRLRHAPDAPQALLVSSRASFEIVQKARLAGIGTVAALGAASTLAVDLARAEGMTLVGFLRADGATTYAPGPER